MLQQDQNDRLIRTLAFALRHDPGRFELQLDPEGWASFDELLIAIRFEFPGLGLLDRDSIQSAIAGMDRFEVRGESIRASYGHTVEIDEPPPIATPPSLLFHGTSACALDMILVQGLLPINRRFVHLTSDREYAAKVAASKSDQPVLVTVRALDAHEVGCNFRRANNHVWLANMIEPRFVVAQTTAIRHL